MKYNLNQICNFIHIYVPNLSLTPKDIFNPNSLNLMHWCTILLLYLPLQPVLLRSVRRSKLLGLMSIFYICMIYDLLYVCFKLMFRLIVNPTEAVVSFVDVQYLACIRNTSNLTPTIMAAIVYQGI